jgi:hypothetical protein
MATGEERSPEGVRRYVKQRLDAGDDVPCVVKSFSPSELWLNSWLADSTASNSTTRTTSSSCGLASLGVEEAAALITAWVSHRREQAEAEDLCLAAIAGDDAAVTRLLLGGGNGRSDGDQYDTDDGGGGGCTWDAEDRFGVTAGEYALYLDHQAVLAALVSAGARDLVLRFHRELQAAKGSHHTRPSGGGSSTITSSIDTSTTSNSGKSGGGGSNSISADSNASAHSAPNQRRSEGYLQGAATYGEGGCLLDQNRMPVMMPWEEQLMCAHAARFVGPAFLNVGFGCGYVDTCARAPPRRGRVRSSRISSVPPPPDTDTHFPTPTSTPALVMGGADPPLRWHCICEAHTDVLTHLKSQGWPDKDGVEVWEGRWQDCVPPRLRAAGLGGNGKSRKSGTGCCFQTIFYDTHDEGVREFLEFAVLAAGMLGPDNSAKAKEGDRDRGEDDVEPADSGGGGGSSTSTSSSTEGPLLFSFWNGMEFNNVFRHAVYCRAVQDFLVAGGYYERVEFLRVRINFEADAWRVWGPKDLRYWHFQSYFLPLCYKRIGGSGGGGGVNAWDVGDAATLVTDPCIVEKGDLSDWMLQGIEKGLAFHEASTKAAPLPPASSSTTSSSSSTTTTRDSTSGGEKRQRPHHGGAVGSQNK